MRGITLMLTLLFALLLLSACAEESSPTDTIQSYLKAQVAGDADDLVKLSCAAWEAEAKTAAASFRSVDRPTKASAMAVRRFGSRAVSWRALSTISSSSPMGIETPLQVEAPWSAFFEHR